MKDVPGDTFQVTFNPNYTKCFIDVQCDEPEDEISLKMTGEKNEPFFAVFDLKTGLDAYGKTANIRLPIWKNYQQQKIE